MNAIARGGRVKENRVRRGGVFRAAVDAVQLKLHADHADVVRGARRQHPRPRYRLAVCRRGDPHRRGRGVRGRRWRRRGGVGYRHRQRIRGVLNAEQIPRDRGQGMRAIAGGGRVPGDRVRRARVFGAEVGAVEFELDAADGYKTDDAYACTDRDRAGDRRPGIRGCHRHDQAAQSQLRLSLGRNQGEAGNRKQRRRADTPSDLEHGLLLPSPPVQPGLLPSDY